MPQGNRKERPFITNRNSKLRHLFLLHLHRVVPDVIILKLFVDHKLELVVLAGCLPSLPQLLVGLREGQVHGKEIAFVVSERFEDGFLDSEDVRVVWFGGRRHVRWRARTAQIDCNANVPTRWVVAKRVGNVRVGPVLKVRENVEDFGNLHIFFTWVPQSFTVPREFKVAGKSTVDCFDLAFRRAVDFLLGQVGNRQSHSVGWTECELDDLGSP